MVGCIAVMSFCFNVEFCFVWLFLCCLGHSKIVGFKLMGSMGMTLLLYYALFQTYFFHAFCCHFLIRDLIILGFRKSLLMDLVICLLNEFK